MKKGILLLSFWIIALTGYGQSVSTYFNQGLNAFQAEKYRDAIGQYEKAIQVEPKHTLAYLGKALAYEKLKEYPSALADYDQAVKLDPNYAQSYLGRAKVYWELGKWPQALEDCNQAIELQPRLAASYFLKGRALVQLERYEDALIAFDRGESIVKNVTHYVPDKEQALNALKELRPTTTAAVPARVFWRNPYAPSYRAKPLMLAKPQLAIETIVYNPGKQPIKRENVRVYINGQDQSGQRLGEVSLQSRSQEYDFSTTVLVPDGSSEIVIGVKVEGQPEIRSEGLNVKYSSLYKPNLYVLAFGIYSNLAYTAADADAIGQLFAGQQNVLYQNVEVLIFNEKGNTTGGEIRKQLESLSSKTYIRPQDVIMLFFSGHGTVQDGNFEILGSDFSETMPSTSLSFVDDIVRNVKILAGKTIILADACHSGQPILADGDKFTPTLADASMLTAAAPPGMVVISSSSGKESSYEDEEWGHGAFTKALLDGLKHHKANADQDKAITIGEIYNYVEREVPIMVKSVKKKEQHPAKSSEIPNIPIFGVVE